MFRNKSGHSPSWLRQAEVMSLPLRICWATSCMTRRNWESPDLLMAMSNALATAMPARSEVANERQAWATCLVESRGLNMGAREQGAKDDSCFSLPRYSTRVSSSR